MALTAAEKCVGQVFRERAEQARTQDLADFPDSASCSFRVLFYRHKCPKQEGRTRSIQLKTVTINSSETWVTCHDDELTVITKDEAKSLVAKGEAVEFDMVLAGKFSFSWKRGQCAKCGLTVISAGTVHDNRPGKDQPGDLSSFTQGPQFRSTGGVIREHE